MKINYELSKHLERRRAGVLHFNLLENYKLYDVVMQLL
jgi:hypothetical protein